MVLFNEKIVLIKFRNKTSYPFLVSLNSSEKKKPIVKASKVPNRGPQSLRAIPKPTLVF